MSLISILIILVIIGAVAYLIRLAPIDAFWKNIIYVVLAIVVIIWLLRQLQRSGFDLRI